MAVHFLVGDDASVLRSAATTLVHQLVGDSDRTLMVDEFDGPDFQLGDVIDSAQTPPFLTDTRVVVARGVGRFTTDELAPLLGYLADPLDSTDLVIEWGSQRRVKALNDALAAAGAAVVNTSPPSRPKDRAAWVAEEAAALHVKLAPPAVDRISTHLGENAGALDGILRTLASTYGTDRRLVVEDVEPFLGEAGGVPPWDLTDAIDNGRTDTALTLLNRMLGSGERHPLQVMAILQGHYGKQAALDGLNVRSEAEAADALGIKPGYPAKKAMELSRKLGGDAARRAIGLLAAADLDLRGRSGLDERLVIEVLVARLTRLRR